VIKTGDDGKAWLHLIGEDGRIITEQKLDFGRQANQRFSVSPEVIFEIAGAAETGRLMISSLDSFGRTISLSSVDLILMKAGGDEINPPILYWEPYLVRSPKNEAVISGGTVLVSGMIRPVNENPVIFELIDTAGRVIAASEMIIDPPSGDFSHTPFQTWHSISCERIHTCPPGAAAGERWAYLWYGCFVEHGPDTRTLKNP
jgi:hypothetical protein